jgi:hypothetical protein
MAISNNLYLRLFQIEYFTLPVKSLKITITKVINVLVDVIFHICIYKQHYNESGVMLKEIEQNERSL